MAKKKTHEQEIQEGLEGLRALGVSLDEPGPGLLGALKSHVGKGIATDLAIAFLLGRIEDPGTLEILGSLETTTSDKEVRREVRRAYFKLRQKGISAPRAGAGEPPPSRAVFSLGPEIEAYMSPVDGAGNRLVWLAKPQPGSGVFLLQGFLNDFEGLLQAGATRIRRKELRRMVQDLKDKHRLTMISVPWLYADFILYRAHEKSPNQGRQEIAGFPSMRAAFASGKPPAPPHPIYSRIDLKGFDYRLWKEGSKRLFEEPEFQSWVLPEDWVKPYLERLQEADQSRLILHPVQKEERVAAIIREAVREIFSGERADLFRRRMEDMAFYLWETRREEKARLALAVGIALKEGDLSGLDVSFLSALIQKTLGITQAERREDQGEPSLIIKP